MASHFAPSTLEPFPLSQFLINQLFMALGLQTHSPKGWMKSLEDSSDLLTWDGQTESTRFRLDQNRPQREINIGVFEVRVMEGQY